MNQQQRLVAIGGSTAIVVLLGLTYWLLRKGNEDDEEDDFDDDARQSNPKSKNQNELPDLNISVASAGQSSAEIFVPKKIVGTIIGRGGANVKQLRNEFAVR